MSYGLHHGRLHIPAQTTHSYRLTPDEYARYLDERSDIRTTHDLSDVRDARGQWVIDGTHASASYDAGWYWVRTRKEIPWV